MWSDESKYLKVMIGRQKKSFRMSVRVSESVVPPHTAGIVPSIHVNKQYGRVLFYDFAGDPEYYSSHAAILEKLTSSQIGILSCS